MFYVLYCTFLTCLLMNYCNDGRFLYTCLKMRILWCCSVLFYPLAEANVLQFWWTECVSVCIYMCVCVCACVCVCVSISIQPCMRMFVQIFCSRTCRRPGQFHHCLCQFHNYVEIEVRNGEELHCEITCKTVENLFFPHFWLTHTLKVPSCLPANQ